MKEIEGWGWFGSSAPGPTAEDDPAVADLAVCFARCFRGADGERVLAHLKSLTVERPLGPGASDAVLRHAEGQRQLFFHIQALVERGRAGGLTGLRTPPHFSRKERGP